MKRLLKALLFYGHGHGHGYGHGHSHFLGHGLGRLLAPPHLNNYWQFLLMQLVHFKLHQARWAEAVRAASLHGLCYFLLCFLVVFSAYAQYHELIVQMHPARLCWELVGVVMYGLIQLCLFSLVVCLDFCQ